jgi:ATP-dependent Lon protease
MRIITEGFSRASVKEFHVFANYLAADALCKTVTMSEDDSVRSQAYCRAMLTETGHLVSLLPSVSDDAMTAAKAIRNPALLADFIASNILVKYTDKFGA